MPNQLNVKYHVGMTLEQFRYANYGFSLTKGDGRKAFAQFIWCLNNIG